MFCNNCGKEIPNQAKFCNYCGAKVAVSQPSPSPRPQPQPASNAYAAPSKPQPAKKKKGCGSFLLTVIIAAVVYFVVRYATEQALSPSRSSSSSSSKSGYSDKAGSGDGIAITYGLNLDTAIHGALYKNSYLIYGPARIRLSNYHLEPSTGGQPDYLVSGDGKTFLSVTRNLEISLSYASMSGDTIIKALENTGNLSNISMYEFKKFEMAGVPCVRYIAKCYVGNTEAYVGEIMLFPDKNPSFTLRIALESVAYNAKDLIANAFDTLSISSEYMLDNADTGAYGYNTITVK